MDVHEYIDEPDSNSGAGRYASLDAAFADQRTPMENRDFIRRLLSRFNIEGYYDRGSYIKAVRRDSKFAIQVHYGWTNGFTSEDEIVDAVGDVDRWPSGRSKKLWGVAHPEHRIRSGGVSRASRQERKSSPCPTCGLQLPATGQCPYCA